MRGLQQVAVAEDFGYQLFGLAEGSEGVGVVADYQYWHASAVEGAIEGVGGELVVEQAGTGERGVINSSNGNISSKMVSMTTESSSWVARSNSG